MIFVSESNSRLMASSSDSWTLQITPECPHVCWYLMGGACCLCRGKRSNLCVVCCGQHEQASKRPYEENAYCEHTLL
jgi:hypothetical protein